MESACARCTRHSLHCQTGSQRRIGRPKRDISRKKQHKEPQTAELCDTDFRFLDDSAQGTADMDWPTFGISPFKSTTSEKLILPSDNQPLFHGLQQQDFNLVSTIALSRSQTDSSNVHFEALSKINVELHDLCNSIFRHPVGVNFESFVRFNDFQGMRAFKIIMRTAQDYLVVIKSVRRMIGTRKPSAEASCVNTTDLTPEVLREDGCATLLESPNPVLSTAGPISYEHEPPSLEPDAFQLPPGTQALDMPLAFLIISCFVQLVRLLEFVVTIMHAHITDNTPGVHLPAAHMSFADVAIVDFSSQALLAIELTQHTFGQIQLVLGLPSPWSRKVIWTGLITAQKYRDMLNAELGVVDGLWTTRPARLMETISETKEALVTCSIAGDW
ncbi:putative Zn(2)-C6 fungal-type domain-containing protein [Seiridium cardinale]